MNKNYGKRVKKLLCWSCIFSLCISSTAMAATGANIGDVYYVADGSLALRVCGSDSVVVCGYDASRDSTKKLEITPNCTLFDREDNVHVDEEGNQIDFRVTEIENGVFAPNKTFKNINIEASTGLKIGASAFEGVVVEGGFFQPGFVKIAGGELAELGDSAFAGSNITGDLTIGNINGSIGNGAFQNMKLDGKLSINGNIDTLGDYAFAAMDIRGFSMYGEIHHMGDGVYKDVYLGSNFILPLNNSLKTIGSRVFEGAVLGGVCLPEVDTVESAAADAFEDGMLIVIPRGLTNLEVFHFDQYKNLTFQTAGDLSDDSPVIQYLKEKGLTYRKGENGELIYPEPIEKPTEIPPSTEPTATPTVTPTAAPTVTPTAAPTVTPTAAPTVTPTATPTLTPTATPTATPTTTPTTTPTATPAVTPTVTPTATPKPGETQPPSIQKPDVPSIPGAVSTATPSAAPTAIPEPSVMPGTDATATPTLTPEPTKEPSSQESPSPSEVPTETPASSGKTNKNSTYSVGALKYRLLGKNKAVVTGAVKKKSTSVSIPGTVTINGKLYQVTQIGKKAFKGMKQLKKVKVGNYVKKIEDEAFAKCPKLQSIQFGTGLVSIGKKVLYQDKGLRKIVFKGTKLKKIGKKTFSGVSPEKVTIKVKKSKLKYYQKLIQKAK